MADKKFGCPACGFESDSEQEVKDHMADMADDPKHQEYDLRQQEKEDEDKQPEA